MERCFWRDVWGKKFEEETSLEGHARFFIFGIDPEIWNQQKSIEI